MRLISGKLVFVVFDQTKRDDEKIFGLTFERKSIARVMALVKKSTTHSFKYMAGSHCFANMISSYLII